MSAEKDVSRDVKKTIFYIGGGLFTLIAAGYLLFSWASTPPAPASRISVDKAAGGTGKASAESEQYRTLLRENNAEGAKQAQAANTSFIASVGTGTPRQVPPIPSEPVPPPAPEPQYQPARYNPQPAPSGRQIDPDRKKALDALLKELAQQRGAPAGQVAVVLGAAGGQPGGKPAGLYADWADSLQPVAPIAGNAPGQPGLAERVVIPAGTRPGGVIDTEIDSDNTGSQVLAHIPAGPYAGAQLMASGVQLAGDGVSIHFTRMTWNNDSWRVDIWAAMPDTLRSSVATKVNNRYGTRILLPALAHGLGLGGQLYASANTQLLSNGYGTIEGRVGMPNGQAIAGTVIGGTAQQAGQVIASDAQKLPVKQVLVERGQPVALLFMTAVKESDKETHTPAPAPADYRPQPARTVPPLTTP